MDNGGKINKKSEEYLLGARSPLITILDLASKQLMAFMTQSVVLILLPFMAT